MVNERYLNAAENLAERNRNRLNTNRSPKEQETDELFYWIMSRLEWSIQGCCPAKTSHIINIDIQRYDDGRVLLKHGNVSEYLLKYVKEEEFDSVMNDVEKILNEIGRSNKKGFDLYVTFFTLPTDRGVKFSQFNICFFTKR